MDIAHGIDMAAAIQTFKSHEVFTNASVATALFKHKLIIDPAEQGVSVKIIFGTSFVSIKSGLGMDISAAMSARIAHAATTVSTWLIKTTEDVVNGVDNVGTRALAEIEEAMTAARDDRLRVAQGTQCNEHLMFNGAKNEHQRNAHTAYPMNSSVAVDWQALLTEGGLTTFLRSVQKCIFEQGGDSAANTFLMALLSHFYQPEVGGSVRLQKGAEHSAYGAMMLATLGGKTAEVLQYMRKFDELVVKIDGGATGGTIFNCTALLKVTSSVPTKGTTETMYGIEMGEKFVGDALVVKLLESATRAAANAASDGDAGKAAKI